MDILRLRGEVGGDVMAEPTFVCTELAHGAVGDFPAEVVIVFDFTKAPTFVGPAIFLLLLGALWA